MKIGIVGLGYVGIQLATRLGRIYRTVGYDLNEKKLEFYGSGSDPTREVSDAELANAIHLEFTSSPTDLNDIDVYIVAVPTPIDEAKNPDLRALVNASRIVGESLKIGSVVIYESTVYPGVTEEICVPVLEEASSLTWREDFHVGYSPERINPGDPDHTLSTITKVISADNPETLDLLEELYGGIVDAGVHRAPSIRVAEAAKVIENTQRDLNIALINELAVIFDRLGINTMDVLEAAGTKWNFLPFKPGLVGGHCIGVDPYYLTHKSQMANYQPEVILSGRRINDHMGQFVASKIVKLISQARLSISRTRIIVFGVTFKEDCADVRNSQVFTLIKELEAYGFKVSAVDPLADVDAVLEESGLTLSSVKTSDIAPVVVLAVPHQAFLEKGFKWLNGFIEKPGLLIDVKSVFRSDAVQIDDLTYWGL